MYEVWDDGSVSFRCTVVSNAIFWTLSLLGFYADHLVATKRSSLLARCKIQPRRHLSRRDKLDLALLASFNMLFVSFFVCSPLYERLWTVVRGKFRLMDTDDWNWRHELLVKIPIHAIVADVAFYSIHRLFHASPLLYRHIHRVHHRFSAPTAMACVYAHPLEFAVGNVLPIYLGPVLTNAHPRTCYLWFFLTMLGTCKGHSGYRIFGLADPHEDHHVSFLCNYGGMYFSDCLFGTTATVMRAGTS